MGFLFSNISSRCCVCSAVNLISCATSLAARQKHKMYDTSESESVVGFLSHYLVTTILMLLKLHLLTIKEKNFRLYLWNGSQKLQIIMNCIASMLKVTVSNNCNKQGSQQFMKSTFPDLPSPQIPWLSSFKSSNYIFGCKLEEHGKLHRHQGGSLMPCGSNSPTGKISSHFPAPPPPTSGWVLRESLV